MQWISRAEIDTASSSLEKRFWVARQVWQLV